MLLTEKQRAKLEAYEKAGAKINWAVLEKKFSFIISPITTIDANVDVLLALGKAVSAATELASFAPELRIIMLLPSITNPEIMVRENYKKHSRASNDYQVSRVIDFATWVKARKPKRIALAVANFKDSINEIPDKHLSVENKTKLHEMIEAQAKTL